MRQMVCKDRRFFWIEGGSFGIGPACMRKGDVVVVLFGGKTPYILRTCGRSYLYIGQAYVDKLMTGNLIEEMERGRVHEQGFFWCNSISTATTTISSIYNSFG